ncbi:BTB/POZ domain-containing protein At1g01640-like [Curcuma longa]|uniref:BTB/POZ domain-containing protein At1g01640-like n=1 Tax=Curcuma longa TaxID=136217 RepID=UPI003D9E2645
MDHCSLCRNGTVTYYGFPRKYTMCDACYNAATSMLVFSYDLDGGAAATATSLGSESLPHRGLRGAFEKMKEMQRRANKMQRRANEMQGRAKEMQGRLNEKVGFLDGLAALQEGLYTDILLKAGDGQPVPAHRAVLASKSEIFKTMLLADDCKAAPPGGGIITLPELTHRELQHLLEFLYSGELRPAEQETFSTALSLLSAADKYDIPFLRKSCERLVIAGLGAGNALDVLDAAQRCSSVELKERAIRVVVEQAEVVVLSPEFEAFASRNAELCFEITRAMASNKMPMNKHKAENRA